MCNATTISIVAVPVLYTVGLSATFWNIWAVWAAQGNNEGKKKSEPVFSTFCRRKVLKILYFPHQTVAELLSCLRKRKENYVHPERNRLTVYRTGLAVHYM